MAQKLSSISRKQCQQYLSAGVAFAYYRSPDSNTVKVIAGKCKIASLESVKSGFLFHPFDASETKVAYLIEKESASLKRKQSSPLNSFISKEVNTIKKKDFINYVELIKQQIVAGRSRKIVAARVQKKKRKKSFDLYRFFEKACAVYPHSFVSLVHIPEVGTWIGASPEVLVKETKTKLYTYSLAGTKLKSESGGWSSKEIEEQKIVTDFIEQKLKLITKQPVAKSKTETVTAGNLNHLRTVFSCKKSKLFDWRKVAAVLHPTPATAGLPQQFAIDFINQHEPFDRAFYSGYLGPVNTNAETSLFVNLRCVEVTDKNLLFYAGGGITADSNAKKEWKETKAKINILKSLLD